VTESQRLHEKQCSLIVANAWADDEFKDRLVSNPRAVLEEFGVDISPATEVCVVEDPDALVDVDESRFQFFLPAKPAADLWEEDLTPPAVAYCYSGGCYRCYRCGCGCGGCGRCGCAI